MRMLWPYTIRLNPAGVGLLCFSFILLYYFYSSSDADAESIFLSYKRKFAAEKRLNCTNGTNDCQKELISLKQLLVVAVKAAEAGGLQVVAVRKSSNLTESSKGKTKEGANDIITRGDINSHITMVHGLSATFPNLRIISEENHHEYDEHFDAVSRFNNRLGDSMLPPELNDLEDLKVPYGDVVVWIDPLDATQEYSENLLRYVTTMVCVAVKGKPIIGVIHRPFHNETYWAWVGKGISKSLDYLVRTRHANGDEPSRFMISRSHSGQVDKIIHKAFTVAASLIPAGGAGFKTLEVVKGNADAYVHTTNIKKWDICAPNAVVNSLKNGKMTTINASVISYNFDESEVVEGGILLTMFDDSAKHNQYSSKLNKARNGE